MLEIVQQSPKNYLLEHGPGILLVMILKIFKKFFKMFASRRQINFSKFLPPVARGVVKIKPESHGPGVGGVA